MSDLPATVLRPASLREASEALREAAADGAALLFRGGGTKLDWHPPGTASRTLDTRGLHRLLAHERGDLTATVEAGMPLAELQAELAAAGQWLAVDPPAQDAGATVGGVFAADDAGPRRLRYGTLRDLAIGCTVVLADGTVARSGGRVIKNVAGFDLLKPLCGSHGTLALITSLTVRLHPLPPASRTLRVPANAHAAAGLALRLAAGPAVPSAVDWAADALWVRLEGRAEGLAAREVAVRRDAAALHLDAETVTDGAERSAWAGLRDLPRGRTGETVVRVATLPDRLGDAVVALQRAAERSEVHVAVHSHAALGLHTVRLGGATAQAHAALLDRWSETITGLGGRLWLRRRIAGLRRPSTLPAAEAALHRRLRAAFDPDGRCGPGRLDWLEAS